MKLTFICFIILSNCILLAQQSYKLEFKLDSIYTTGTSNKNIFLDSIKLINHLNNDRINLLSKGYLLASIDTITWKEKVATAYFYKGPCFKTAKFKIPQEDFIWISANSRKNISNELILNPNEISELISNCQRRLLENGYPFSKINIIEIKFKDDTLIGQIKLTTNEQYKWGNLIIKGDQTLNNSIIKTILDIRENELYNETIANNINTKLSQIPYIEQVKPFELLFNDKKVDIYLYIKSKHINYVSGTIGLQQNANSNGYSIIGDLKLKLTNVLKRGENIDLQWRNLQNFTQSLKSNFTFPTLFKSSFGTDVQFQLFKKDSTFLELKSNLSIQYLLANGNTIKFNYRHITSSLLNTAVTLNYGNVSSNYYGISLFKQKLNYLPCPTYGYSFTIDFSLGIRNSFDNITSLSKTDNTSKTELNAFHYITIHTRNVIKLAYATEIFIAPSYFQNELIRFGGLATQRGFREEELRATSRIFGSIEYRFLLDKNSFLFLFYDQSWYENKIAKIKRDHPLGFGSGISFGTNIGIFSISYGIGKQFDNPLLLKNGNIHFGYISYF